MAKKSIVDQVLKPKKTQAIVINFILDESGSMSSIREATISGFNEYINGLKEDGNDYLFTLTKFDTAGIRIPYENKKMQDVPELTPETYQPSAGTPLLDAVGDTVEKLEKTVKKDQPTLVIILTDGEENSSQKYTRKKIADLIGRLQAKGNWTFTYMGANQDAWHEAGSIGIGIGNTVSWDSRYSHTAMDAFASASSSTKMYGKVMTSNMNNGVGAMGTASFFDGGELKKSVKKKGQK